MIRTSHEGQGQRQQGGWLGSLALLASACCLAGACTSPGRSAPSERRADRALFAGPELPPDAPVIDTVVFHRNNVFGSEDRAFLYQTLNHLHWVTEERVIRRELLLKEGDLFDFDRAAETERILRALPFLADARVRGVPRPNGHVELHVETWDRFSLRAGASFGLFGGDTSSRASLGESNLLGSGKSLNLRTKKDSEDSASSISYFDPQFMASTHDLRLAGEDTDEGGSFNLAFSQPFRSLDSHFSYGFNVSRDRRLVDFYEGGDSIAEVPTTRNYASVFLETAEGPRDFRKIAGMRLAVTNEDFSAADGSAAGTIDVPGDQRSVEWGPTFASEFIQRFVKRRFIDQLDVTEDITVGVRINGFFGLFHLDDAQAGSATQLSGRLQLTSAWDLNEEQLLTMHMLFEQRQFGAQTRAFRQLLAVHYYNQAIDHHTIAASIAFDRIGDQDGLEPQLTLGEDNGLRGYPSRFFSGDHRLRLNLEDRILTNLEIAKVKIGIVPFFDLGFAWDDSSAVGLGDFYRSVGIGLRLGNASLLAKVARIDFAFPLDDAPGEDFTFSVSASAGQLFSLFSNAEGLDAEF